MRFLSAALAAGLLAFSAPAFADCVDFSPARARAAQQAVLKNPPTPAKLGVPNLNGLTMDVSRIGDPACSGDAQLPNYTSTEPFLSLITNWHPNIRRRTNVDGMKREWFENPKKGDSFFLTSGAEVTVIGLNETTGAFAFLRILPPPTLQPLTAETQPYSARDIAEGPPWPGGGDGPRQFVRADGGDAGYRAANNNNYTGGAVQGAGAANPQGAPAQGCPPPSQAGASRVASEVAGAVGGDAGRRVGAALGGLMGRRNAQAAPSNCPP